MEESQSVVNKILRSEFVVFGAAVAVMVVLFILFYSRLPAQIPLFYSRPSSDRQITDLFVIFLIPLMQCIFLLINMAVRKKFYNDNEFIGKLLHIFNMVIIGIGLYIFVTILFLVT